MSGDWVILGTFSEEYKAVLLEAALKEDEIPSVVINRKDSAYRFMGQVELYVKKDDYLKSRHILEKLSL